MPCACSNLYKTFKCLACFTFIQCKYAIPNVCLTKTFFSEYVSTLNKLSHVEEHSEISYAC